MRTGSLQLTLHNGDIAMGQWWSGQRRDATALLRRHLPELALGARDLADLLDGEVTLLVVRLGGRTAGEVCRDEHVRARAAHLAAGLLPSGQGIRRTRPARPVPTGKVEAA